MTMYVKAFAILSGKMLHSYEKLFKAQTEIDLKAFNTMYNSSQTNFEDIFAADHRDPFGWTELWERCVYQCWFKK